MQIFYQELGFVVVYDWCVTQNTFPTKKYSIAMLLKSMLPIFFQNLLFELHLFHVPVRKTNLM